MQNKFLLCVFILLFGAGCNKHESDAISNSELDLKIYGEHKAIDSDCYWYKPSSSSKESSDQKAIAFGLVMGVSFNDPKCTGRNVLDIVGGIPYEKMLQSVISMRKASECLISKRQCSDIEIIDWRKTPNQYYRIVPKNVFYIYYLKETVVYNFGPEGKDDLRISCDDRNRIIVLPAMPDNKEELGIRTSTNKKDKDTHSS
jgi:hypothetical protein